MTAYYVERKAISRKVGFISAESTFWVMTALKEMGEEKMTLQFMHGLNPVFLIKKN